MKTIFKVQVYDGYPVTLDPEYKYEPQGCMYIDEFEFIAETKLEMEDLERWTIAEFSGTRRFIRATNGNYRNFQNIDNIRLKVVEFRYEE